MNIDSLTERPKGFLQSAQSIALRENHQQINPLHLLKALLDDKEGQAARLIDAASGDSKRALSLTDQALEKLPKVEGSSAQMYFSQDLARAVDQAVQLSKKAGDAYVITEYLLLALSFDSESDAGKILSQANLTPQALNNAINEVRPQRKAGSCHRP